MRQSIVQRAFASWAAMSSAAAESTACSPAIDGELSMTQRKSTLAARPSRAPAPTTQSIAHRTRRFTLSLLIYYLRCLTHAWAQRFPRRTSKQGATEELCGMRRRGAQGGTIGCGLPTKPAERTQATMGLHPAGGASRATASARQARGREPLSRRLASRGGG